MVKMHSKTKAMQTAPVFLRALCQLLVALRSMQAGLLAYGSPLSAAFPVSQ